MNLAQQGIFLVVALLICEFGFIGSLTWMLGQAESEAVRQEHAREVNARASRLFLLTYEVGNSATNAKILAENPIMVTEKTKADIKEVPELLNWLKENLKGEPEPEKLLARIERNVAVALPKMQAVQTETRGMSRQEAMVTWKTRLSPVNKTIDALVMDIEALMDYARKIEQEAPEFERSQRESARLILFALVAVNVVFFIVMVFFFTRSISGRLGVITDNVQRLKRRERLHEPLKGKDEIARVDRVFHETADAVTKEEILLRQSESRLRNILESVPIGVAVLNEIGSIELVNLAVEKSFGFEPHELLGRTVARLLAQKSASGGRLMSELISRASGQTIELTAVRRDGSEFPVDFTLDEITIEGQKRHLAMILDATERYEIKKLRQSFVEMIGEELRTPLTKVNSFFSRYRNGQFGPIADDTAAGAEKSQQNIERLLLLLNDLFDLESLESGKIDIEPEDCGLSFIFDRSLNAVCNFAEKHQVSIELQETQLEIFADPDRVVQVLVNLLSNAIKFSPPQGVVSVTACTVDSAAEISVVDRGKGIPADKIGSLFQRYQQVETADTHGKGGTGLGLVICKAIVEEHGGKMGVASEEGVGSRFWFQLPLSANAARAASLGKRDGNGAVDDADGRRSQGEAGAEDRAESQRSPGSSAASSAATESANEAETGVQT